MAKQLAAAFCAAALVAGCGGASRPQLPPDPEGQYGRADLEPQEQTEDAEALGVSPSGARMTAAQVWAALPQTYAALGLRPILVDSTTRTIGVSNLPIRKPIGGEPVSRALQCGTGPYGPNADRYEVHLTMLTAVREDTTARVLLDTRVRAYAVANGVSGRVRCWSNGRLEQRIVQGVLGRSSQP